MTKVSPTMRWSNHPPLGKSGIASSFYISSLSTAVCLSLVSVIKSTKIMINMSGIFSLVHQDTPSHRGSGYLWRECRVQYHRSHRDDLSVPDL